MKVEVAILSEGKVIEVVEFTKVTSYQVENTLPSMKKPRVLSLSFKDNAKIGKPVKQLEKYCDPAIITRSWDGTKDVYSWTLKNNMIAKSILDPVVKSKKKLYALEVSKVDDYTGCATSVTYEGVFKYSITKTNNTDWKLKFTAQFIGEIDETLKAGDGLTVYNDVENWEDREKLFHIHM